MQHKVVGRAVNRVDDGSAEYWATQGAPGVFGRWFKQMTLKTPIKHSLQHLSEETWKTCLNVYPKEKNVYPKKENSEVLPGSSTDLEIPVGSVT